MTEPVDAGNFGPLPASERAAASAHPASVAVIITCYNEGRFVEGAVRSVLDQTLADRISEIIVVDDGSGEETLATIRRLPEMDPRITTILQSNAGLPSARNRAIEASTATYIAILDADDLWSADKLEKQLPLLDANDKVGIVYADLYLVEPDELERRRMVRCASYRPGTQGVLEHYFVNDAPIIPSTAIIRREVFTKVGLFDPSFRLSEDNEMWIRILADYAADHVPEALLFKRFRLDSLGANVERSKPYIDRITELAAGRYPRLRPLKSARSARRLSKLAQYQEASGDSKAARKTLIEVIRLDPRFFKAYYLYLLTWIPKELSGVIQSTLKRIKHN